MTDSDTQDPDYELESDEESCDFKESRPVKRKLEQTSIASVKRHSKKAKPYSAS